MANPDANCALCGGAYRHKDNCPSLAAQASDEPMRAAFWKFIATLPTPMQDNISTSEARGESLTATAFATGYRAALATSRATADVERDAARWRALLGSARIRMIGSAGLNVPEENQYAHFGMEIWTRYGTSLDEGQLLSMAKGNAMGREWLTKYADIAIEAQIAATKPGEPG